MNVSSECSEAYGGYSCWIFIPEVLAASLQRSLTVCLLTYRIMLTIHFALEISQSVVKLLVLCLRLGYAISVHRELS